MSDFDLNDKARRAVLAAGFEPEFRPEVMTEVERVTKMPPTSGGEKDLRHLEWSSIDNEDSRDLDQVEFAQRENNGTIRLLVGIADVVGLVPQGGAIDAHAEKNTTTLYTGPRIFPMLPEELSTNATSLLENQDRTALVVEMLVEEDGRVEDPAVYRALVRNHARLSYEEAGDFLENRGGGRIAGQEWLARQLRLQGEASERLMELRKRAGALTFSSNEPRVIKRGEQLIDLKLIQQNRARDLIESFMIAANISAAKFLKSRGWPILDRVVAAPKRWDRIREIARRHGTDLPMEPNRKALSEFLAERRKTDPEKFADLSLAIVKLLGPGEYIIEYPDGPQQSHFGLAVDDYSHSTAPNRRFADLLLQRLIHALLARQPLPYSKDDLERLAAHCNERQTAERKVERLMRKVCAALLLQSKIGQHFRGIITGASDKGTFVRLFDFPAEGKIVRGTRGLDVGDKVSARLIGADPENGFIDFEALQAS